MRNSKGWRAVAAAVLSICCITTLSAAAPDDTAARLRAALRTATVQVRELQDQNAVLTAQQAEAERQRLTLTQQVAAAQGELAALRQQIAATQTEAQAAAQQAAAQLEAQRTGLAMAETTYRDNLARWQMAYNEAADTARTRDADAKRLDGLLTQTRVRVQACEAKNTELFKLGGEVLDLYGRQDMLSAFGGSEPFTRLKRVELENLVQDYEDRFRTNTLAVPVPNTPAQSEGGTP